MKNLKFKKKKKTVPATSTVCIVDLDNYGHNNKKKKKRRKKPLEIQKLPDIEILRQIENLYDIVIIGFTPHLCTFK